MACLSLHFGLNCVEGVPYYDISSAIDHTSKKAHEGLSLPVYSLFAVTHRDESGLSVQSLALIIRINLTEINFH